MYKCVDGVATSTAGTGLGHSETAGQLAAAASSWASRGAAVGIDRLLLTGATGFIGGNVLVEAVNAGLAHRLVCLVRAQDHAEALGRLRENAIRCGLLPSRAAWLTEDNILLGGLGSEFDGPSLQRLREVSHVVNCAAVASFSSSSNVGLTNVKETLRFAANFAGSSALARFVHVGTAMACGAGRGSIVYESQIGTSTGEHLVPYTRSKHEAEIVLRDTLPWLPLVVARPSIVVGHTVLGTSPSPSIFWLFRIVHRARRFAAPSDARLDVISADDCARALLQLAAKPRLSFGEYHLSAGTQAKTIAQLMAAMDEATGTITTGRRRYAVCSLASLDSIAREVVDSEGGGNARLVARALRLYAGFAELNYCFDNQRLREEIGFDPLPLTDYIGECVRTSQTAKVIEQMRWDFKS